jgi:hypothetical protein
MRDDDGPGTYFDADPSFSESPQIIASIPEANTYVLLCVGAWLCLRFLKSRNIQP